jgi:hypothetical protein
MELVDSIQQVRYVHIIGKAQNKTLFMYDK